MIEETAGAKINLFLHVGPIRADGLHELTSLFVFARDGDAVVVSPSDDLHLEITGPFAPSLRATPSHDNLVFRAAAKLRETAAISAGATIALNKRLPISAGIGGGSADAAAALRALVRLWNVRMEFSALRALAFSLGADVPACLEAAPVMVRGAGERIESAGSLPGLWVCLVNPGVETLTGPIFRAFDSANPSPPSPDISVGPLDSYERVEGLLARTRNDLEPHAISLNPVIGEAREFLAGCQGSFGARMSGSGSTVFALFASSDGAVEAAERAQSMDWWSMASPVASGAGGT
jgi:4-diphosphocytidyl-2-C-methyl-D-erythritol kinase